MEEGVIYASVVNGIFFVHLTYIWEVGAIFEGSDKV